MTITSFLRGHPIEWCPERAEWVFCDTGDSTAGAWMGRPCGHCGAGATVEGHDGCLGTLPGVMNACCGHGQAEEAYVQYRDGNVVRGADALAVMQRRQHEQ